MIASARPPPSACCSQTAKNFVFARLLLPSWAWQPLPEGVGVLGPSALEWLSHGPAAGRKSPALPRELLNSCSHGVQHHAEGEGPSPPGSFPSCPAALSCQDPLPSRPTGLIRCPLSISWDWCLISAPPAGDTVHLRAWEMAHVDHLISPFLPGHVLLITPSASFRPLTRTQLRDGPAVTPPPVLPGI